QFAGAGDGGCEIARAARIAGGGAAAWIPPGACARRAAAIWYVKQQAMAGRQGKNIFDQSEWFGDAAKEQIAGEGVGREAARDSSRGEQGAEFRGKRETFLGLRVVERLDAQRIAG